MAVPESKPHERLREEILTEARREAERIIHAADQEAAALLQRANAAAEEFRSEFLKGAEADAARRRETILARLPVETNRARSAKAESVLESIRQEVGRRLEERQGFDYQEAIITLAAEAVAGMTGDAFVLQLSSSDGAVAREDLPDEITRRLGGATLNLKVGADSEIEGGGVVVADAEGRQLWDNRLLARLERMWPDLRRQIALRTSLVAGGKPMGDRA
jgi:vacuolar-type H+-ATPase subunit E/Vma4